MSESDSASAGITWGANPDALAPDPGDLLSPVALLDRDLEAVFGAIRQRYFAEVPCANPVEIIYGAAWKHRLGAIRLSEDDRVSCIRINALLRLAEVPMQVLVMTIAHELVHYTHGFGALLPRRYATPHAGGGVARELEQRGLGEALRQGEAWIEQEWFRFYARHHQAALPVLDLTVPPTRSHVLALEHELQAGGYLHPTPSPLTAQEATWLQSYLRAPFPPEGQLLLTPALQPARAARQYALTLVYQQCEPVLLASFSDWKRLQGWAADPARFAENRVVLTEQQQQQEWERLQGLRAIMLACAHDAGQQAGEALAFRCLPEDFPA